MTALLDIIDELRETPPMGRFGTNVILALSAAIPLSAVAADGDTGFLAALASGRPILELRPRYNHIEETDKPETTEGTTYRAIAGWRSAPFLGARVTVEAIATGHVGPKRFNDDPAFLFASPYPLLPDPSHAGVNQAHVELSFDGSWLFRAGRQRVFLDDGRWVSDNDFRQVPQLFDGATAIYGGIADVQLYAGHFRRVRNTSGDTQDLRLTLLRAAWNPLPAQSLSAFGYFHDQPQNGAFTGFANNSYRVLGVRFQGSLGPRGLEAHYVVEAARQRAHAGGDPRIDARYWRAGAGIEPRLWGLRLDHEVKGSNEGRYGVQMPLTDFYAFNGWSLRFFNTPREGLRDTWLTARWSPAPLVFYAEWHRFRADFGGGDLGREIDASVAWRINPETTLRLQHADYRSGGGTMRIRKTWLTLSYNY